MILEKIVNDNLEELAYRKHSFPLEELKKVALRQPQPLDLALALGENRVQLIAEVKRHRLPKASFVQISIR